MNEVDLFLTNPYNIEFYNKLTKEYPEIPIAVFVKEVKKHFEFFFTNYKNYLLIQKHFSFTEPLSYYNRFVLSAVYVNIEIFSDEEQEMDGIFKESLNIIWILSRVVFKDFKFHAHRTLKWFGFDIEDVRFNIHDLSSEEKIIAIVIEKNRCLKDFSPKDAAYGEVITFLGECDNLIEEIRKSISDVPKKSSFEIQKEKELKHFKDGLSKYGFFDLPKVKLKTEIEALVNFLYEKELPYQIAFLHYLGFIEHLNKDKDLVTHIKRDTYLARVLILRDLSAIATEGNRRDIRGNINIINKNSTEKTRYKSYKYKENVINDYAILK